jgi:hypothetical protein
MEQVDTSVALRYDLIPISDIDEFFLGDLTLDELELKIKRDKLSKRSGELVQKCNSITIMMNEVYAELKNRYADKHTRIEELLVEIQALENPPTQTKEELSIAEDKEDEELEAANTKDTVSGVTSSGAKVEQMDEATYLYRYLAQRTHPDRSKNKSARLAKLFILAKKAKKNSDVVMLRKLKECYDTGLSWAAYAFQLEINEHLATIAQAEQAYFAVVNSNEYGLAVDYSSGNPVQKGRAEFVYIGYLNNSLKALESRLLKAKFKGAFQASYFSLFNPIS